MDIQKIKPWNWFSHEEHKQDWWDDAKNQYRHSVEYIQRELDKLKEGIANTSSSLPSIWPLASQGGAYLRPRVDIAETEKQYVIMVEVPGVAEDDITLEVDNLTLQITGEKKQPEAPDNENFHQMERSYGKFRRIISLPEDTNAGQTDATFKDGVLTITIPRAEVDRSNVKKVNIKRAA